MNQSIFFKAGDTLTLGYAKAGARTYIGIQGIPDIEVIMGSYSTYTLGKFGGWKGRALQAGDVLKWKNEHLNNPNRQLPEHVLPHFFTEKNIIRVMRGPEWDHLSTVAQNIFQRVLFSVQNDSNRMGIRLKGADLSRINNTPMPSSATLPGTIQLPPNGQPIILMHDGQTTGGYPRIAKVIEADLGRLAQIPPHGSLCFRVVNEAQATRLLIRTRTGNF